MAGSKLAHQVRPAVATAVKFLCRSRNCKIHELLPQNAAALCLREQSMAALRQVCEGKRQLEKVCAALSSEGS